MPEEHRLHDVIVDATFEASMPSEPMWRVRLRIGKPVLLATDAWACPYQLEGLGDEQVRAFQGVDPLHALSLTIHAIPTLLTATAEREGVDITWRGQRVVHLLDVCRDVRDSE